jgi:signal transduction histidine kinase
MTVPRNAARPASLHLRNALPAIAAVLLVAIGISLAAQSEQRSTAERVDQASVQARIMAATLTGALAFDDVAAAREYLDALKLNPDIHAAAAYTRAGKLVAGFTKDPAPLPSAVTPHPAAVSNRTITVIEPVRQGSLELGAVYVKSSIEPVWVRLSRYLGIGLMIVFAAVLIFLLGRSFTRAAQANQRLREEIVARELAERALVQAQKMEAIGHLTGGIAHDFNNLLMAASSGLELLERSSEPQRRQRYAQGIREALDRGARLTRQLLTFARGTSVNPEVVDIRVQLRAIQDLLERSLRGNIVVTYELDDDLWPVFVDPVQFEVCIVNIAVNARDAMPQGGTIRITARNVAAVAEIGEAVCLAIADDGCGMPQDLLPKVFDPFFTTKPVGQGTGLGLSQVYGFVRSAAGQVALDSAVDRGTTISLYLPRCTREAADRQSTAQQGGPPAVRSQTVLVVEDDPRIADSLCEMLRQLGCSPLSACGPDEALDLIAAQSVDVVLSDMMMPGGISGLELATMLRDRPGALSIILMTGYSDVAQRARDEGFRLLAKPFTIAMLAQALNCENDQGDAG